jgi:two-component system nitrate/nitrite response regulator NarL
MIRVLVVEEVRTICEIIATVLRSEPDLVVVGCATGIDEAVAHLSDCDVAVVNACMTTDASVRLVRGLRRLAPRVKIVVIGLARSQHAILQCVEAGVAGYVLKDSSLDELLKSIRAADRNEPIVAPPLAATLVSYVAELVGFDGGGDSDPCGPESLTRREREVLGLVQQGLTNQEIAAKLVIELGTVKNHVHNILRKLNVNSRRDAVHVSRLAGLWGGNEHRSFGLQRPVDLQPERASLYSPALGATN